MSESSASSASSASIVLNHEYLDKNLSNYDTTDILVIDDEPYNLEILQDYLLEAGYSTGDFANPVCAWEHLDRNPNYKCILLDRMMPEMDGLDLLAKIKQDIRFQHVPVIMQTADGSAESLCAGMQRGAFYYLTKPFSKEVLLTVVEAAVLDYKRFKLLQEHLDKATESLMLMHSAKFKIKTLGQADMLAALLAKCTACPQKVVLGLSELLINAIEHGNLEIDFNKKTDLLATGSWREYIDNMLNLAPYANRYVTIDFNKASDKIEFIITDQGQGFEWQNIELSAAQRVMHTHGRGLLIAKNLSFDGLEFLGKGNKVKVWINT